MRLENFTPTSKSNPRSLAKVSKLNQLTISLKVMVGLFMMVVVPTGSVVLLWGKSATRLTKMLWVITLKRSGQCLCQRWICSLILVKLISRLLVNLSAIMNSPRRLSSKSVKRFWNRLLILLSSQLRMLKHFGMLGSSLLILLIPIKSLVESVKVSIRKMLSGKVRSYFLRVPHGDIIFPLEVLMA